MLTGWGRTLARKLMRPKLKPSKTWETNRWKIVTGDMVQITQGPQAGQQGKVLEVLRKANRIKIEGCNMRRRIVKAKMDGTPGKIVVQPCTVHYSNVALLDPTTGQPTKVSRRYLEDGSKVRVSKASGQVIPIPPSAALAERKPRTNITGPKDTETADVYEVTFADYEKYLPHIYDSEKDPAKEEQKR